jgi:hypothetical protein
MQPVPLRVSAIFLFSALLCASSLPRLTVEELVSQSDTIVAGHVVRSWTAMDPENRFIWTHYEIRVGATLKGQPQPTVVIGEPGGTLNRVTLLVPGAARYTPGEEVGVFLYRTPIGYLRTTNYGQGKFAISADGHIPSLGGISWTDLRSRIAHLVASPKEARR